MMLDLVPEDETARHAATNAAPEHEVLIEA
jgi:hypothetical protein